MNSCIIFPDDDDDELLISRAFETLYSQNVLSDSQLPRLKKVAKRRNTKTNIKAKEDDASKDKCLSTRLETSPSLDSTPQNDELLHSYTNTTRSTVEHEHSDSGYPDLASPNIDALELSIIGYSNKQYDSVGDLFMMHKPRRHRCNLVSQRLNLEKLWARAMFPNHQIDQSSLVDSKQYNRSQIFLKRNVCKRQFAAYMKSMEISSNKLDKSSNRKTETSSMKNMVCQRKKSKCNYKENKLKKIKLDIEKVKVDCDSDGVAVVQTWRRKEIVKKGEKLKSVGNSTEKVVSSAQRSNRSMRKKAVKSVGICLPQKKMATSTKDDESVSGVFKSLFSTYNNLSIHCGGVWKEIVSEDTK